jgi:3'-5' exonuclease
MERRIIFDIETVGKKISELSIEEEEYLFKSVKSKEEYELAEKNLNLYPLTAQIVCIGFFDVDSKRARMYYQSDDEKETFQLSKVEREPWLDNLLSSGAITEATFYPGDEKYILTEFWNIIRECKQFVTFNGRSFDCPFILLRSAYHKIKPTRDIMPYRYSFELHCDLLEQLTFYGANRRFSLDFFCKFFGIESPKSHGVTGLDMNKMFKERRFEDIARYCLGDIEATAKLYRL